MPSAVCQICFLETMRGWRVEGGTRWRTCDFSKECPGQLGAWGWGVCKSFHGHSQQADVTAADTTHDHPSKVTPHTQKRKGTKVGMGITISVTWLRKHFL